MIVAVTAQITVRMFNPLYLDLPSIRPHIEKTGMN